MPSTDMRGLVVTPSPVNGVTCSLFTLERLAPLPASTSKPSSSRSVTSYRSVGCRPAAPGLKTARRISPEIWGEAMPLTAPAALETQSIETLWTVRERDSVNVMEPAICQLRISNCEWHGSASSPCPEPIEGRIAKGFRYSPFAILLNDSHRDDEHVAIRIVGAIGFRHP